MLNQHFHRPARVDVKGHGENSTSHGSWTFLSQQRFGFMATIWSLATLVTSKGSRNYFRPQTLKAASTSFIRSDCESAAALQAFNLGLGAPADRALGGGW